MRVHQHSASYSVSIPLCPVTKLCPSLAIRKGQVIYWRLYKLISIKGRHTCGMPSEISGQEVWSGATVAKTSALGKAHNLQSCIDLTLLKWTTDISRKALAG